ncbi:peptidase M48-like protein [Anaerospora hongkongensis]|uniref:Peptidase M48-like protein n=1 Tax=Anaerospora hongkongensis TaxID=244830 RepID=A0A4R1PQZ1_9FIRM|nr:M48 family metallopeptidase [Anaerospora hongkongensis]TCL32182.1 peptidase M48-like protein [Anaerospora hongkongensis]
MPNCRSLRRLVTTGVIAIILSFPLISQPVSATGLEILGVGLQIKLAKDEIKKLETNGKPDMMNSIEKDFGTSYNPETAELLDSISTKLIASVQKTEQIKTPFLFHNNANQAFNATRYPSNVITINDGVYKFLNNNQDELAMVIGHEIGHGQGEHLMKDIDKVLGLQALAGLYLNKNDDNFSQIFTNIVYKQVKNGNWSQKNESDADRRGFHYATESGFNPGAGAAVWARIIAKSGEGEQNVLAAFANPSDHPAHRKRIENHKKWMTEYSGNRISVKKTTITLDGKDLMTVNKAGSYEAEERTYIIAGNLSRAFHDNPKNLGDAWVNENGTVYLGGQIIATPRGEDTPAWTIADMLNAINKK